MSKKNNQFPTNNQQIIIVPKGSLVMMCAAPNSGKTHFSKKHFGHRPDVTLVCSDEYFLKNVQSASAHDTYESIMKKTTSEVMEKISSAAQKNHTVVIDATSHFLEERLEMIEEFKTMFKNIVLIVIDLEIPDLLSHGVKPQLPIMKRFNMYTPKLDNTMLIALLIKSQFVNGDIRKGVNAVHRVTSQTLNNCAVVIK